MDDRWDINNRGVGVAERLGPLCREARELAGRHILDVSTRAEISEAQLSFFERGMAWPRTVDNVVAAYEIECGLEHNALWQRAVDEDQ